MLTISRLRIFKMARLVETLQTDLPTRVYRVTNGFNESLYLAANEPSLGMYRIQEHVQSNVPKVVDHKQQLQEVLQRVDGACFDVEYATQTVTTMATISQFSTICEGLDRAIEFSEGLKPDRHGERPHERRSIVPRNYGSIQHTERPAQSLPILTSASTKGHGQEIPQPELVIQPKHFD